MPYFLLFGVSTGMRTMTATAVLCWFAYLKLLPQTGWAAWSGMLVTVIIFTVLAVGEYIGDVLPTTPSRLAPGPLIARLVFGSLAGALAMHAMFEPVAGGVILGLIGALIGAYGGFYLRRWGAKVAHRDLPVGLLESLFALLLALFAARTLHEGAVVEGFAAATHAFARMPF